MSVSVSGSVSVSVSVCIHFNDVGNGILGGDVRHLETRGYMLCSVKHQDGERSQVPC